MSYTFTIPVLIAVKFPPLKLVSQKMALVLAVAETVINQFEYT
jgi:hypothetical protein